MYFKNPRLLIMGGSCAIAISACAPSYHTSIDDSALYGGYGHSQSGYGYEHAQTNTATFASRYGGELRGSCETVIETCGLMAVVPVYPVYQYVTYPPVAVPEVQVVEVPSVVEPDPIPYVEPEPVPYEEPEFVPYVYEPVERSWPEPDAPVQEWRPLRK